MSLRRCAATPQDLGGAVPAPRLRAEGSRLPARRFAVASHRDALTPLIPSRERNREAVGVSSAAKAAFPTHKVSHAQVNLRHPPRECLCTDTRQRSSACAGRANNLLAAATIKANRVRLVLFWLERLEVLQGRAYTRLSRGLSAAFTLPRFTRKSRMFALFWLERGGKLLRIPKELFSKSSLGGFQGGALRP